jgi:hypothetical protein
MTMSDKYHAGFCVLTIKVVGYDHKISITREVKGNVCSNDLWRMVKILFLTSKNLICNCLLSRSTLGRDKRHGIPEVASTV